jgi:hypothetical protein
MDNKIEIIGNIYKGREKDGDFHWMIKQDIYKDILFLFNDNEEYHDTNARGAGNAIIRKYNKYNKKLEKPRSAGIPTGTLRDGGYEELNDHVKKQVKTAIQEIKEIIIKYNYKKICYSSEKDGILGTGIFTVDRDVLIYITNKIKKLESLYQNNKEDSDKQDTDKLDTDKPDTENN